MVIIHFHFMEQAAFKRNEWGFIFGWTVPLKCRMLSGLKTQNNRHALKINLKVKNAYQTAKRSVSSHDIRSRKRNHSLVSSCAFPLTLLRTKKNTCNISVFALQLAGLWAWKSDILRAAQQIDRQTLTLGEQISLCPFSLSASDSSASAAGMSSLVPGSSVTCCIISFVSSLSFITVLMHCTSGWWSGRGSLWCTVLNWIWAERQYSSNPYRYLRFKSNDKKC